jgi:signal transduction histidine kinase
VAKVRAHAGGSPPRLLLRFALYSGVVLAAAGLAILWIVDQQIADRAERTVENKARMVAEDTLRRQLRSSDFAAPVSNGRRSELDGLVRTRTLIPGVVGVRLVNRDGTITYAALHRLIGTRATYRRDLAGVFEGVARRRVTKTTTWRGRRDVKVLQELIPVRLPASKRAIGALELDQDYNAIKVNIAGARNRLALILAAAFLALYVALFPILRRVTRELEARNRGLRERVVEREQLLAAERTARSEAESVQRLLTEQNDRLRELDRMKDEFVSLVSHQLRTPLTSIRGYVELLLEDEPALTPDQQRFLTVVDRNAHRLVELVGDLLFLAQVDAGRLEIDRREVDLAQLVRHCVEATRPIAGARRIELESSVPEVPTLVGDPSRLAQVLDNLVANAIKFTGDGGRVTVTLAASADRALVTVGDTGPGISPADLEKIFDRFYRSANATAHAIPGSGLGLPIAKAIVDGHGGRIAVASEEGRGTTVRLELPLAAPWPAKVRPQGPPELQRAAR